MNDVATLFNLDFRSIIIGLVAILAAFKFIWELLGWVASKLGIELRSDREKREYTEILTATSNQISEIGKKLACIEEKVDCLDKRLTDTETKNDESERARIKDRIAQSYRLYHERKQWTEMEKESFNGLIQSYEAHGGTNSFVHKICEPESFTWRIVEEEQE